MIQIKMDNTITIVIIIGLLIVTGTEKKIETYFVESGVYNVSEFELNLLENSIN